MAPLIEYAELCAKTNYSFLEGASFPEEVIHTAKTLGYRAIGICDRNGVYGVPRAHVAAKELSLPLLIGSEILWQGIPLFLIAKNREGYGNLCELLTLLHSPRPEKSLARSALEPKPAPEDLEPYASGLLTLVPPHTDLPTHHAALSYFFPDLFLTASHFVDGTQPFKNVAHFESQLKIPAVATNQPLFHLAERKILHDVLTSIRHTVPVTEAGFRLLPNSERHLKSLTKIQKLFQEHPAWISRTLEVVGLCSFSLDELRYRYPNEWLPPGMTGHQYLENLSQEGLKNRYPEGPPTAVIRQLERELQLISSLQYVDYFLTIWDIVQFAKSKNILYQGRGSAANSLVCYLLEITPIDPIRMDLLFERFISKERHEPPDIDIDFEHERREEVIQYIYSRYGRDRAAITAEVICFRKRSALREVAKALGISLTTSDTLRTLTHRRSLSDVSTEELKTLSIPEQKLQQWLQLVEQIQGFPRHLGTHVGGFVLCEEKLTRNTPIQAAAMEGRTIVQWDKNDLDALGFVRVDILGLGILTCIRKCFEYVSHIYKKTLTIATIPAEDPAVYESIGRADTIGVFQIESRAQMNMLPRLKPRDFFDLVVEISLIRPGPIQGDMVHPYLRRRQGLEKVEYPHPDLKAILEKTYGVPLFQEQIMKMAMVVAGFSGGEADKLRRAMGAWRRNGKHTLSEMGERFRKGLMDKGIKKDFADRIFSQIEGFAEYGFPESHAASFAVLAYATAYLKHYYPDAYLAAILNAQPMGFYQNHTLVYQAIRQGVQVLPIDINHSLWNNWLVQKGTVRLGFREIRGLSKKVGEAIEKAKPFLSFEDFIKKTGAALTPRPLTKRDLFFLAACDAFQSISLNRRDAFWNIQALSLQDSLQSGEEETLLPKETRWEHIALDFESTGLSLYEHPLRYLRQQITAQGGIASKDLPKQAEGKRVKVSGIVVSRQMPATASGVLFITLEDEYGFFNLVIWNKVFQNYREVLLTQSFLLCEGKIQKADNKEVIHIIVDKATSLLHFASPSISSHDWG